MAIHAMLVDDEVIVRRGLRFMLPFEKYDIEIVAEASSGEGALQLMEKSPIQLLFTDITMPGMNGLELMKQVNLRYPLVKTVVLTCHQDFGYIQEALRLGAIDYIVKTQIEDSEVDELLSRIKEKVLGTSALDINKYSNNAYSRQSWTSLQWIIDDDTFKDMMHAISCITDPGIYKTVLEEASKWEEKLPGFFSNNWKQKLCDNNLSKDMLASAINIERKEISQKLINTGYSEEIILAILKALDMAYLNIGKIRQEDICSQINMSRSYFSKSFKEIIGRTFIEYVQDMSIKQAKILLRTTNRPLYQIAEQCGFQDDKYFSKIFREKTGQSVSEYRLNSRIK